MDIKLVYGKLIIIKISHFYSHALKKPNDCPHQRAADVACSELVILTRLNVNNGYAEGGKKIQCLQKQQKITTSNIIGW